MERYIVIVLHTCKKGVLLWRSQQGWAELPIGAFGEKSDKPPFFLLSRLSFSVAQRCWSCSRENTQSAEIASFACKKMGDTGSKKEHMIDLYGGAAYPGTETLYGRRRWLLETGQRLHKTKVLLYRTVAEINNQQVSENKRKNKDYRQFLVSDGVVLVLFSWESLPSHWAGRSPSAWWDLGWYSGSSVGRTQSITFFFGDMRQELCYCAHQGVGVWILTVLVVTVRLARQEPFELWTLNPYAGGVQHGMSYGKPPRHLTSTDRQLYMHAHHRCEYR